MLQDRRHQLQRSACMQLKRRTHISQSYARARSLRSEVDKAVQLNMIYAARYDRRKQHLSHLAYSVTTMSAKSATNSTTTKCASTRANWAATRLLVLACDRFRF